MSNKSVVYAKEVHAKEVHAKEVHAKEVHNKDTIDIIGVEFSEGLVPLNHDDKKEANSSKESSNNPINGMISMYNSFVNNNYSRIDSNDDIDYREK